MQYALINTDNEIIREQWFEDEPPALAEAKGLQWMSVVENYPVPDDSQKLSEITITVDRQARTLTKSAEILSLSDEVMTGKTTAACSCKCDAVDTQYLTVSSQGYSHDFGGSNGVHVLQTREIDYVDWLSVAAVAQSMVSAGNGASTFPGKIRTKNNINLIVTAAEALAAMLSMQAYIANLREYSWALKDDIIAITDNAELSNIDKISAINAVDIATGWPVQS
jgi:hypothetical protein